MAKLVRAIAVTGLVALSVSTTPALTDENEYMGHGSLQELLAEVENTSFVWFREPKERDIEALAKDFATQVEPKLDIKTIYPNLGGFAVRIKPEEGRRRLEYLQTSSEIQFPKDAYIESDALVYSFQASCVGPAPLPTTSQEVPTGIRRVGEAPDGFEAMGNVWIIDSGLADEFDGSELSVDRSRSRECSPGNCVSGNEARMDSTGHGTMIAGIIAAIDDDDGYVGVAPAATVIPIKVFHGSSSPSTLGTIYNALDYLIVGADSGDVVNISWGFPWWPVQYQQLEQKLMALADQGVKIAIAAGNNELPMGGGGYVQTATPARIGGYESSSGNGGTIITVSAVESDDSSGMWIDTFWPDSFFGNGEIDTVTNVQKGPPNFAEPGVNIRSLWPGGVSNTCTGTSFAAPHMSGILLHGMPAMDGLAKDDPSALIPAGTDSSGAQCWTSPSPAPECYDDSRRDPVGVLP